LEVRRDGGKVSIISEGSINKMVNRVRAVSFSAKNALARGQRVMYVTERCVLELTERGLKLVEVYDGIDKQRDILDRLPFNPL
jgi:propionate CoA-transferase